MKYTIGRSPENDMVVPADTVSARHAILTTTPGGYFIVEDVRSTNYTFINNRKIEKAKLFPDDILWIADQEFSYQEIADSIQKLKPAPGQDFSTDFSQLQQLYQDFHRAVYRLEMKRQVNLSLVNVIIVLITMLVCSYYLKGDPGNEKIVQGFASIILILGYLTFHLSNNKPDNKKENLLLNFLMSYRCPSCGHSFEPIDWKIISANGCDHCKLKLK